MTPWWVISGSAGLTFAAVGILFVVIAHSRRNLAQRTDWIPMQGSLVEVTFAPIGIGSGVWLPVVDYPLPDGTMGRFTNQTSIAGLSTKSPGTPVSVLVDPADPRNAQVVGTAATSTALSVIAGVFGTVFAVAGVLVLAGTGVALWLLNR